MAKRSKLPINVYQVKDEFAGKIKLETGEGETLLDHNTPQLALATLYEGSDLAKGYIELVASPEAAQ
ncbi:hypothetical protein FAES_2288 [Fibrella aestuarina BUZ 2]|uniref:Uncharacterized protein n=1 Tax=Fibrella aestuarina BUZ 2 TaxID=1166018 RepID=I0K844_9BACT|nr:hypothetical protein [Fibrella aestuarina]CCH00297.1 hypothetical protein FAES_2288 [Fibrella aestuarina BUZ 2]